jgi:hypothetical protein
MEEGPKNDVVKALEFWKDFNLDDKRLIFDKQVPLHCLLFKTLLIIF